MKWLLRLLNRKGGNKSQRKQAQKAAKEVEQAINALLEGLDKIIWNSNSVIRVGGVTFKKRFSNLLLRTLIDLQDAKEEYVNWGTIKVQKSLLRRRATTDGSELNLVDLIKDFDIPGFEKCIEESQTLNLEGSQSQSQSPPF